MKAFVTVLCFLVLHIPAVSKERDAFDKVMLEQFGNGMGRSCNFHHLANRSKRLQQNRRAQVVGMYYGLDIKLAEDAKVAFPDGESWVESPAGDLIPLLFKQKSAKKLPGYWQACFSRPFVLVEGLYKYHVTLVIDGNKQAFNHIIRFSSYQIERNRMEINQTEG